ncbi:hypothetical protein PM082_020751 [Marasmius tenuissimus]|nr:hypothetical protein PM082_020751 [Marasmius tenuissimus]
MWLLLTLTLKALRTPSHHSRFHESPSRPTYSGTLKFFDLHPQAPLNKVKVFPRPPALIHLPYATGEP